MTEDEAKTKWCPFVRAPVGRWQSAPTGNRGVEERGLTRCIASACMAWRPTETAEFKSRAETAYRREGARLTPGPNDVDGFCGLAGAPR